MNANPFNIKHKWFQFFFFFFYFFSTLLIIVFKYTHAVLSIDWEWTAYKKEGVGCVIVNYYQQAAAAA